MVDTHNEQELIALAQKRFVAIGLGDCTQVVSVKPHKSLPETFLVEYWQTATADDRPARTGLFVTVVNLSQLVRYANGNA